MLAPALILIAAPVAGSWLVILAARICGPDRHGAPLPAALGALCGFVLAALSLWRAPDIATAALGSAFLLLLLALFETDRLCFRLPDPLTLPLLAVGMGLGTLARDWTEAGLAAGLGAGAFWLIGWSYARISGRDVLGLGDVKMMAGLSAALGVAALGQLTLLAALLGLAQAAWGAWSDRDMRRLRDRPLPFGCSLALAAGLLWLMQQT